MALQFCSYLLGELVTSPSSILCWHFLAEQISTLTVGCHLLLRMCVGAGDGVRLPYTVCGSGVGITLPYTVCGNGGQR